MNKIIKSLSSKIYKLEMENKNQNKPIQENDNQNSNQYRRPLNPIFFPRDRRNSEDQKIQPPFQNDMVENDERNEIDDFDFKDLYHNIDQLDDSPSSIFLTKFDYHYATIYNSDHKDGLEKGSCIPNVCQESPKKNYGLRPRTKQLPQDK